MTTRLADNQAFITANRYWLVLQAWAKSQPLDVWRNAVLMFAAFWLVHSFARLFWVVYPLPELPQPTRFAAPVVEGTSVKAVSVDIVALQELKLFGDAGDLPIEDIQAQSENTELMVDEDAATTRLNLKLHGVIASDDSREARAIIDVGNEQALYRIGEEIKKNKGVKLAKVMDQRVILDNKGAFESLWLYSEEDFKKSAATRNSYKVPRDKASAGKKPVSNSITPNQIPKSISDVVRFSVHREDGKMIGYKVRPGRDKVLFEQVGLKSGDIVTSVNGREMTDPKQLREVYQDLKTATEASLVVRRNEEEIPITVRVDSTGG